MKRGTAVRAIGLCIAGTSLFFLSTAAYAAPAPEGSYQKSCRNFTASQGTLTAECQTTSGSWNNTTLAQYRGCSGDISNNNGTLTCARAPGTEGAGGTRGDGERSGDRSRDGSTTGSASTTGGSTAGTGSTTGGGSTGDRTGTSDDGRSGTRDRDRTDSNNTSSSNDGTAVAAPRGSYKDTCRNAHIEGSNLVAECKTVDGQWHRTTLDDYRRCDGDISNNDGRLRCQRDGNDQTGRDDGDRGRGDGDRGRGDADGPGDRGPGDRGDWDRAGWQPPGSYQETCRRIKVERGDLEADCRTRSGSWRHSELDNARDCRGDIANDNGRLVCTRARNSITLYQHSRFGGQRRSYNDNQPSLGGFANIASSANVQGGRWQLCTRTNYRGRCVTIDRAISNFNVLGINDRVQSLRRVR
jgi:hypothetical protein